MPIKFSNLSKSRQQDIHNISCDGRKKMLFFARPNGRAGWKLVSITIGGSTIFLLVKILQWLSEGYRIVEWVGK